MKPLQQTETKTMGQYFKFVNPDREEFIQLPGGMKLIERITDPAAMAIVGFMLFEGPCDGTHLGSLSDNLNIEPVELQQKVDEQIIEEKERTSDKDYTSIYYDEETTSWERDKLRRVVVAGYDIDEALDYCGRWAGDSIRLVGDYADNGLYGEARTKCRYRRADGSEFTGYSGTGPLVNRSPGEFDGSFKLAHDEITHGDTVAITDPETNERICAEYIGEATNQWTDITDPMLEEMHVVTGNSWFLDNIADAYRTREFEEQSDLPF
jgi:hypothetical protein